MTSQRDAHTTRDDPDLVDELSRRARERHDGAPAAADAVAETLRLPSEAELLARLDAGAVLHQSQEVHASSAPLLGRALNRFKRAVVRASQRNLQDALDQQTRVNLDVIAVLQQHAQRIDGARPADDAALQRAAARLRADELADEARWIADLHALEALPDGDLRAGVADPDVLASDDAGQLASAARHLARVTGDGGVLVVAAGPHEPTALAALLLTAGFRDAERDPHRALVVARR